MANPLAYLLAIAVVCSGLSRATFAEDHAKAMVLADVSAVQPGTPFMLGIKFTIDPGWHIYWKNPGDSGLPTDVKLTLPHDFTAGELMFPAPERIELPGPVINYGYEKEVMLMVPIMPAKDLQPGKSIIIAAKTSWLVCNKDNCVPGSSAASVELPVTDTATPANTNLFKSWKNRLPVKQDSADIASTTHSVSITNGDGAGSINIGWKNVPADLQYIPGPLKTGDLQDVKLTTTGNATKITYTIKGFKGDEPVTGLLTFLSATGARTGVEISTSASK